MNYKQDTICVRCSSGPEKTTGAISFPIYQSATFRHPALYESTGFDYSRDKNPTRQELEDTIALLENGTAGFAFATGMAAISAAMKIFNPGDHLIVSDDLYGGTYRIFKEIFTSYGLEFTFTDTSDFEAILKSKQQNTKGIFLETPSNPMMKVTDIAKVTAFAKNENILTLVDNTFLTPYFQQPLNLGADIVIHSGTKYLAGHNDTLSGFVVVKDASLQERIKFYQMSTGAILSPFDSWLTLRGIKTLALRLEKHQANALFLAEWLKTNQQVENVYYIGLQDHKDYEISKKQNSGFGGMISFTVKNPSKVEQVLKKVKLISFAESLGGVESLITYPIVQTHADVPEEILHKLGVNDRLLRFSVGIENANDLIADLEQALA